MEGTAILGGVATVFREPDLNLVTSQEGTGRLKLLPW